MERLGLDLKILVAQIINFGILLFVLKKVLYKPIIRLIDERNNKINDALINSEKIEERLKDIEEKERTIMLSARAKADKEHSELLKAAEIEKQKIIDDAKAKAEIEVEKGLARLRAETNEAISSVSEKILADAVSALFIKLTATTKKNKFPLLESIIRK